MIKFKLSKIAVFAISIITVLLFKASDLAGREYFREQKKFDLLNQMCWVGFCLVICILLFEVRCMVLLFIWIVLLIMSSMEVFDEYMHLNDAIRGADYINIGFALVSILYIIIKSGKFKN